MSAVLLQFNFINHFILKNPRFFVKFHSVVLHGSEKFENVLVSNLTIQRLHVRTPECFLMIGFIYMVVCNVQTFSSNIEALLKHQ